MSEKKIVLDPNSPFKGLERVKARIESLESTIDFYRKMVVEYKDIVDTQDKIIKTYEDTYGKLINKG